METSFQIEQIETHREIPIFHLEYLQPTVFDRSVHEEEIRGITSLPADQFGLIISCQNLSFSPDYTSEAQATTYRSPAMEELRRRAVSLARYNPESQDSLIRTMAAHLYARRVGAGFAPDLDTAIHAVKKGLDRHLEKISRGV